MNVRALEELLLRVRADEISIAEVAGQLRHALDVAESDKALGYEALGYARVDYDRQRRLGLPEVVFGECKTGAEIAGVVTALRGHGQNALVTRVSRAQADEVQRVHPDAVFHERARCLTVSLRRPPARLPGPVAVVTAGTGDLAVADEAALTLELAGEAVERLTDVGVAGLHRLLHELPRLEEAVAIICIAGMEGALPSVLGGLVGAPVVAVPTSVGYGVSRGGYSALFGMLSSCAAGLTVVNIDNGFGAAMAVLRMAHSFDRARAGSS